MNNFNPYFNPINMTRSISPFATAGSSTINGISQSTRTGGIFSRLGTSKMTLSGILNGAQKTIGTVNQIVPLYNQVKPMFQNSKILLNVAKGLKGDGNTNSRGLLRNKRTNRHMYKQTTITVDPEPPQKEHKKENPKPNEPSKPFFV